MGALLTDRLATGPVPVHSGWVCGCSFKGVSRWAAARTVSHLCLATPFAGAHDDRKRDRKVNHFAAGACITVFGIGWRWKSASTGRRNRLPHLLRQTIDPARWGRRFRLTFQWPQSTVGI